MTVILKDTVPPIIEVAEFGYAVVAVYSLLCQSAYQDQRYDKRHCIKRRDCGGTTNWSHKGIANKLHMGKQKVIECIDLLLSLQRNKRYYILRQLFIFCLAIIRQQ